MAEDRQMGARSESKTVEPAKTVGQVLREETRSASSALEDFEDDLNSVEELLAPFAGGTKAPHDHIDELKESYEKLQPLDEFLAHHLRDHRGEMPEYTRKAMQSMQAHASGLAFVLLAEQSEGAENPARLRNFISHTIDAIEDIKPVLRDLDAPGESP